MISPTTLPATLPARLTRKSVLHSIAAHDAELQAGIESDPINTRVTCAQILDALRFGFISEAGFDKVDRFVSTQLGKLNPATLELAKGKLEAYKDARLATDGAD